LDALSIQTDADGSRRIGWMIKRADQARQAARRAGRAEHKIRRLVLYLHASPIRIMPLSGNQDRQTE
jgi:hypothetical protein